MGTYANVAIFISLLYYMSMRPVLRKFGEKQGFDKAPTVTNFHATESTCRPIGGKYYEPNLENVFVN